jgi:PAS domain S-box-containing protein
MYEAIGYPLIVVAALELLLGYLLLRQNPRDNPSQKAVAALAFFSAAFSLCTALMYVRASLGLPYNFFARANWIGWFTVPAALQFIYYLKDEQGRTARVVGTVLYLFWSAVLCLSLFTDLIVTNDYVLFPYSMRPGPLDAPLRIVGTGLVLWVIVEVARLRRRASGSKKTQLNYFLGGMLIFAGGGVFLSGILPLFSDVGFEPGLGSVFSLPWVVLTFYAITRHGLFDLRIIISRSLTIVLQSFIFSTAQLGMFLVLEPAVGPPGAILISLPLVGFLFFGTRFSSGVEQWVSGIVIKGKYDYQRILEESTRAVVTILGLNELLDYLIRTVRTGLGVRNACLYLGDHDNRYSLRHSSDVSLGSFCRDSLPDDVLEQIRAAGRPVMRTELDAGPPEGGHDGLRECLDVIHAEIVIPLLYKGELRGVLALGRKGSGEPYVQGDVDLLEALASHAAVALENTRLYEAARRATESLTESEGKFHSLAQTVPAAIFIHRGGRILYANSAGESMTGYALGELLAMSIQDVIHPEYRPALKDPEPDAGGRGRNAVQEEFKIIRKDGQERWVIMSAGNIEFTGKPAVIGALFDITEHKKLEGKLRYAQKMEALGKLAGGVAHDFNNILTGIVGYGSRLQELLDEDSPLRSDVDRILASSERAAELVRSLLSFGARREARPATRDLNDLIARSERFLSGFLPRTISFAVRLGGGKLPVSADSGQIERVLMNLVTNARDAMPGGGRLLVETGTRELDAEFIKTQGFGKLGTYAFFSVRDTGSGMDESLKKQVFEPFFTTKSATKGTGFGLSIVYDIIKAHHGYVTVQSEPGKGASFFIYLPLDGGEVQGLSGETAAVTGGREKVLIIDDDPTTRKYFATVLAEAGYRVIEAVDGAEGLRKFKDGADGIGLVIMDMMMPRMNGRECSRAIRKERPDSKVLFVSGYSDDLLLKTGILEQGQRSFLKPVSQQDLLHAVRAALDEATD